MNKSNLELSSNTLQRLSLFIHFFILPNWLFRNLLNENLDVTEFLAALCFARCSGGKENLLREFPVKIYRT